MEPNIRESFIKICGEALAETNNSGQWRGVGEGRNEIKKNPWNGCEVAIVVGGGTFGGEDVPKVWTGYRRLYGDVSNGYQCPGPERSFEACGVNARVAHRDWDERGGRALYSSFEPLNSWKMENVVIFGAGTGNPFSPQIPTAASESGRNGSKMSFTSQECGCGVFQRSGVVSGGCEIWYHNT